MQMLIRDCCLLDANAPSGYLTGRCLTIENNRIVEISDSLPDRTFDEIIDASDKLVIPGLINAHSHSPETLGRASHDKLPLEPWIYQMIEGLGTFTPEDHAIAAQLGAIETIRTGGTAILDHLTLPGGLLPEVLDAVMVAYRDIGIRARVAPILRDPSPELMKSPIARTFAPQFFGEQTNQPTTEDEILSVAEAFLAKWHMQANGRLRGHVGPSGIQWSTIPFLHKCQQLARRYCVGVHTHLMETRVQDQTIRSVHGLTATAVLEKEGLLGPDWSLAHSIWLTRKDIRRIAEAGAVPVHNPAANMRLGSGWSPIRSFMDAGCLPALGADGSMSGDHQNMFTVLHLAAQIHNSFQEPVSRWVGAQDVQRMATEGGARALMQSAELGKVAPGYLADLTLLDLNDISMTPLNDAFAHLAFAVPTSAVDTVIIDGKIILKEGRFTTINEKAVLAEARKRAARLPFRKPRPSSMTTEMERLLKAQQTLLKETTFEED